MSRRAKVYRCAVGLASALFLAVVVVGGLGVYRGDRALMHAMALLLFGEFAVLVAVFVIRVGPTKPHPR